MLLKIHVEPGTHAWCVVAREPTGARRVQIGTRTKFDSRKQLVAALRYRGCRITPSGEVVQA